MKNKNYLVIIASVAVIASLILMSCSSTEELIHRIPTISDINHTNCLSGRTDCSESPDEAESFKMTLNDNQLDCVFKSRVYPCDFGKANCAAEYSNGCLTIVEWPMEDLANCLCPIDMSFVIKDFTDRQFRLKLYSADSFGQYNPESPKYDGHVDFTDSNVFEIGNADESIQNTSIISDFHYTGCLSSSIEQIHVNSLVEDETEIFRMTFDDN